jgi:hypothetical protein
VTEKALAPLRADGVARAVPPAEARVSVKVPSPSEVTEADMASPGCTGLPKNTGGLGKISYQPW